MIQDHKEEKLNSIDVQREILSANGEKFYITTAIAYASKVPHVGNIYGIIFADVLARFNRFLGKDVFFLTGTDEHGQKIENIANANSISPEKHVDFVSGEIKRIYDLVDVSYDKFIRTTEAYHKNAVQKIFKKLNESGDIYKGEYKGFYCTPCESFWTDGQLKDGFCPDCGRIVTESTEEAYFLKTSKYKEKLLQFYNDNPEFIKPEFRKNEMLKNFLNEDFTDLCVSRSNFKWGIPVDFDEKHVIYVWIDALSNYITALGYLSDDKDNEVDLFSKYWPADLHVVGKDILRFHVIYWPIILMALNVQLPKQVFGHSWLLIDNNKMSKSSSNEIYTDFLVKHFGVDATRYLLLRDMPHSNDGSIDLMSLIGRYNTELANAFGNLVNRVSVMAMKYFGGYIRNVSKITDEDFEYTFEEYETEEEEEYEKDDGNGVIMLNDNEYYEYDEDDEEEGVEMDREEYFEQELDLDTLLNEAVKGFKLQRVCLDVVKKFLDMVKNYKMAQALSEICVAVNAANKYIEEAAPWKLAKDENNKRQLENVIYNLGESIRIITTLLMPIMPSTANKVSKQFGFELSRNKLCEFGATDGFEIKNCEVLFKRFNVDDKIKEMAKELNLDIDLKSLSGDKRENKTVSGGEKKEENNYECCGKINAEFVTIEDFKKFDIRVGKIIECERVPKSDKLLRIILEVGNETRQILSGISKYYEPERLIGRSVLFVANLKPAKIMGLESNGMILSASDGENLSLTTVLDDIGSDSKVG